MADLGRELLLDGQNLPFSADAEKSVLGAILIDKSVLNEAIVKLKPDYFYLAANRGIYTSMCRLQALSQTVDYVTVLEACVADGVFDENTGRQYLKDLVEIVPSAKNAGVYIDIVRDKYYIRALITAAREIIEMASRGDTEPGLLLDAAEQRIFEIREGRDTVGLRHIKDIIEGETYERLAKITNPETKAEYEGIPTGIGAIDRMLTGLYRSDLIILGARPAVGKSALAMNIAVNAAEKQGKTVAFFSLEMTRDQLAGRILSGEASISSEKLRTGDLHDEEWTRLAQAGSRIGKIPLYIDETSAITVPEVKAKLRRMQKVDLAVIDYLGLMQPAVHRENRVQDISEITRSLKIMAKELNIPVLVCAQLSRGTEQRGAKDRRPVLSDLRESGSIEQDADIVMFLYKESPEATEVELNVAKNRHGSTGGVKLHWDGEHTRFTSQDNFH